ncbi:MAG: TetR/AcrR family transcriptional regulator [Nitrososphaerales archaeon]
MTTRAGLNFEKVVSTAIRLADKDGLENLTLGRIANEFGVKPPSLYEHVDGLDGLQHAIRLQGFYALNDILRRATVGKSQDEAIRSLAFEMRKFAHQHPALYESTVITAVGDSKEIGEAAEEVLKTLNAILAGYAITGKEAIHAARYLRSLLHGFVSLERARGFGINVDLEESYHRLVGILAQDLQQWKLRRPRSDSVRSQIGSKKRVR